MTHVFFTTQASQDLHEIRDFIAGDSVDIADRFVDTLEEKCQRIAETPYIGRARDELAPSLRSFTVGHYVILYRPLEDGVRVFRVLHSSRDIPALF